MQKKKKKKIRNIILIAILLLILIILLIPNVEEKILESKTYDSYSDIPNIKAAVHYIGGKYIKEELSTDENFYLDVYLEFEQPLYTQGESNENYFGSMVQVIANVINYYNFQLIDTKNEILIQVLCDTQAKQVQLIYINGDSNYYGNSESKKQLIQYEKTKTTDFTIKAEQLKTLLKNEWKVKSLDTQGEEEYDGYMYYPEENVKVKSSQGKTINIIFGRDFEQNIISEVSNNAKPQEIIDILGEPAFKDETENLIGYKGEEIYIFFSQDQISVYPVFKTDTDLIETMKEYDKTQNLKKFVSDITDIWQDYDNYYYDSNTVDLSYILRGVKVQYGVTVNHGITFYNNYTGKVINNQTLEELSKEESIQIPSYIFFSNKDAIAEYELERVTNYNVEMYGETMEAE